MTVHPLVSQALPLLAKAEDLGLAEGSVPPGLHQALDASLPALLEGGLAA